MISEIIIPDLGATGGDVTLEEWLVKPGDPVKTGQALYVVVTDKATVEVESFRDGFVHTIFISQGESVPLGAIIGLLADTMDEKPQHAEEVPADKVVPVRAGKADPRPPRGDGRILASPLARRIAASAGIPLDTMQGSGSGGQILKRDVLAAMQDHEIPTAGTALTNVALSPMRRSIAERTALSKSQIPHFYADTTIDMHSVLDLRRQALEIADHAGYDRPSITDICIRAAALSLREFPSLNARFNGHSISLHEEINLGLVIGLDEGMLVPVIQGADLLNIFSLATATKIVRQQAEIGRLSSTDFAVSTFTISNLGMFAIDSFTAVINPPEVAILALGAIKEQPAVVAGQITIRPLMIATLSVDHRVIDGILAAKFLSRFKDILENPLILRLDLSEGNKL